MKSLFILASTLALAGVIGAAANAAPADVGPATENLGVVGKVFVTTDPASDMLNSKITAHNDAIEAENQAAQATYQAQQAQYEAEKKAEADAYTAQLAEHDAKVAADMAAWHARVKACEDGDRSQCAQQDPSAAPGSDGRSPNP
jgi:Skp family chaperone for outer membrane proteins